MTISLEELRELYLSCVADRRPEDRDHCPVPEDIDRCLRGSAKKRKKKKLVEHITRCAFCLEEFLFVLETLKQEKELLVELKRSCGPPPARTRKIRERTAAYFRPRRTFPPRLGRKAQTAAAAAALLIAAGTFYFSMNRRPGFRSPDVASVRLIRPVRRKVTGSGLLFRWRELEGADHYIFELFDASLLPIWKSPRISGGSVELPPHIAESLAPGSTFFWYVAGFTAEGQKIESPLTPFTIKK